MSVPCRHILVKGSRVLVNQPFRPQNPCTIANIIETTTDIADVTDICTESGQNCGRAGETVIGLHLRQTLSCVLVSDAWFPTGWKEQGDISFNFSTERWRGRRCVRPASFPAGGERGGETDVSQSVQPKR